MKKLEYQKLNKHIAWRIFNVVYGLSVLGILIVCINKSLLTWSIPWYFKHLNDINAIFFPTKELLTLVGITLFFIIFYFIFRRLIIYIIFNK